MKFTVTLMCHGCGATQTVDIPTEPVNFGTEFAFGWARLLVPKLGGTVAVGHEVCPACAKKYSPPVKEAG